MCSGSDSPVKYFSRNKTNRMIFVYESLVFSSLIFFESNFFGFFLLVQGYASTLQLFSRPTIERKGVKQKHTIAV